MSIEQAILEAVHELPVDKQQEILDHATRLRTERAEHKPFKSIKGLWADLGISLSAGLGPWRYWGTWKAQ